MGLRGEIRAIHGRGVNVPAPPKPAAGNHAPRRAPAPAAARQANVIAPVVSPLFILAPPRSFTSVVCAMLGEHPQMYGVCELHLGPARTMAHWWRMCDAASFGMADGLLRVIAELRFGGQTAYAIECARGWLRRRAHWTSGYMIEALSRFVAPKVLVEKSPSIVYRIDYMRRTFQMFPQARFLHLTRHPIAQGRSVMEMVRVAEQRGPVPYWMLNLASYPYWPKSNGPERNLDPDPQRGWLALNANICEFLKCVPPRQQMRVRGEDLLAESDRVLPDVCRWLGIRTDTTAIRAMLHPEHSPYAGFGPPNAYMGNDGAFMANPRLRPKRASEPPLGDQVEWPTGVRPLLPAVKELAGQFGYR
jgi:Sulfotransferase family